MQEITILGPNGLPYRCACGEQAVKLTTGTFGTLMTYCAKHDPAGPPCPLCDGSGHLPR